VVGGETDAGGAEADRRTRGAAGAGVTGGAERGSNAVV
jgi:hypothetical protein